MRQLKFKVWDINKNVFIPNDVYAIINRTDFGAFGVMVKDWEDYREGEYFYDNAQVLIEATGLTDKNGVEIYEGDVMGRTTFPDKVIIWHEYGFGYYRVNNNEKYSITYLDQFDVVIGNIYEHPHLINQPA